MVESRQKEFIKVVCVSEGYEYEVLEEKHSDDLDEIHSFIKSRFSLHPGCRWLLIPMRY